MGKDKFEKAKKLNKFFLKVFVIGVPLLIILSLILNFLYGIENISNIQTQKGITGGFFIIIIGLMIFLKKNNN